MNDLFFLLVFIILAFAFAIASVIAGFVCEYKSDNIDTSKYECGMIPFLDNKFSIDIKFLNFAVLFLIFDIETIFLFPFAVAICEMETFVLVEIVLFVLIFLFALFYAIKKKILRWQ